MSVQRSKASRDLEAKMKAEKKIVEPGKVYWRDIKHGLDQQKADRIEAEFKQSGWIQSGNSMFTFLSYEFMDLVEEPPRQ